MNYNGNSIFDALQLGIDEKFDESVKGRIGDLSEDMPLIKNAGDKMEKINGRFLNIEKAIEKQQETLNGMQMAMGKTGFNTSGKELLNIAFEMKKILDEIRKLKVDMLQVQK